MAEPPITNAQVIAGLMATKKELEARLRQVQEDHTQITTMLHQSIAEISSQLRTRCDHEWIRDNHAYADLYCKHCRIWR